MKRCWFGGGLLLLLLALGLFLSLYLGNFLQDLSKSMESAAVLAGEDREKAQLAADSANAQWERRRWLTAVLSDHDPMEEIGEDFRLLNPRTKTEDFRAVCLRLSARLNALGTGQLLTLENLF